MQSNPLKPKTCGVPPVLSLALLIFLLQSKRYLEEEFGSTSTLTSSLGFPGGSLKSMDWDVAFMLQGLLGQFAKLLYLIA